MLNVSVQFDFSEIERLLAKTGKTEFLVGAKAHGYRITEVGVTHLPRAEGKATGAKPAVILHAFRDLPRFRLKSPRKQRFNEPVRG
jgi:hypothetical protein